MKRVSRRGLALSLSLSLTAGYVDAIGFIETGGLFVSFMSGNSTQAGVDLWNGGASAAALPILLVASFVVGVAAGGVVVGAQARRRGWVVAGAAAAVLACAIAGTLAPSIPWRFALLAAAMGALNTLFLADGRARVAITYATGTLVSLGLALADLVTGRSRTSWRRPLLLWGALTAGAAVGAAAHRWFPLVALPAAAAGLGALAIVIALESRR